MKRPARAAVLMLGTALLAGLAAVAPAGAAVAARPYDFDGDGYPDLVVGAPDLSVRTAGAAGGVVILPASARGLSLAERVVTQSSRGVPGASERGDRFGSSVTSADFDRDGYADLAVGQPGERIGTLDKAGAVTVVYGSSRGLDTTRSSGITAPSGPQESEYFGEAVVAGDFNADGYPDLAVGAPWYDPGPFSESYGTVTVLPGGPTGVTTTGARVLDQQQGPPIDWQLSYRFGSVLAAGDLDVDGVTDLVVGSGPRGGAGAVSYCLGRSGGPDPECTRLFFDLGLSGMTTLVVGHMMDTPQPQIFAGSPLGFGPNSGGILVIHFPGAPVVGHFSGELRQNSVGIPGTDESGDRFGHSLAIGDVDRDGYDDLAVGADGEDRRAGRVTVIYGAPKGWRTSGNEIYDQNTPGVPWGTEERDRFGSSVTMLDHNRDGRLDLAVGAQGENDSGAVTTLRGSGSGFTTTGSRTFGLSTLRYAYPARAAFGATLGR
jgi:FG-GAP repeat